MKNIIKIITNHYLIWKPSAATKIIIHHWLTREQKKSFGPKHVDKTFYVIRSIDDKSRFYIGPIHNLLANYFYVLSHLCYAQTRGWIPIVDQLNYPVYNSQKKPVNGSFNAWEYFWKQPCAYTLDEVYQSKNVVLSKRSWFGEWDMGYDASHYTNHQIVSHLNTVSMSCPLIDAVRQHIDHVGKTLLPAGKGILGVSVRFGGHSKNALKPGAGHPIQPEVEELIGIVERRMAEWAMDYVFLASDEGLAVEKFRLQFGDKLLVLPRRRIEEGRVYSPIEPNPLYTQDNLYQTTLDYLTEMEILSRCGALIGSVTSGLRYAVVRKNGAFEHLEIIDRGRFPDPNRANRG